MCLNQFIQNGTLVDLLKRAKRPKGRSFCLILFLLTKLWLLIVGELGKHKVPIPCLSNSMEIFIYPCSPFLFEHVESNFCFDENKNLKDIYPTPITHQCTMQDGCYVDRKHMSIIFLSIIMCQLSTSTHLPSVHQWPLPTYLFR